MPAVKRAKPKQRKRVITISLAPDVITYLDQLAQRQARSRSAVIELFIRQKGSKRIAA